LYGRSKLLGEVVGTGCLTIRTSLVGWELRNRAGLFEWFASQRGTEVQGYRAAVFSGLLTTVVADVLDRAVLPNPSLCGLRHVAARPISKYDLLTQLRDRLDWRDITIDANTTFACDRSLDGTLFDAETGWRTPDWSEMVETAAMEWREYSEWRTP
jgi:dTDP-4-dehydrorhamnose reductase